MRLRSVVRALLSLVPVLIAVGAASLVAWAFDLQLSPMTAVGGPLVRGAVHRVHVADPAAVHRGAAAGPRPREAVDVTAARTGRAFIVSALTAIAGVAVIAFSSLPLLRDFGMIVAMNVTVALLSAPGVPAADAGVGRGARGWVTRGLTPHHEPTIHTEDVQAQPAEQA